jgi:hypothetical protein
MDNEAKTLEVMANLICIAMDIHMRGDVETADRILEVVKKVSEYYGS